MKADLSSLSFDVMHLNPSQFSTQKKLKQFFSLKQLPIDKMINLCRKGVMDVNSICNKKNKRSIFHLVASNRQVTMEEIKTLFELKGDPNQKDKFLLTPLHYICQNDKVRLELLQLFLVNKCDLNLRSKKGYTALKYLIKNKASKKRDDSIFIFSKFQSIESR